jgi:hypothetical protein
VEPIPEATALAKIFGLTAYTGRDKFCEDHREDIEEYSKTLSDDMNAGGKVRKAQALLWAKEDQASWEAVAKDEKNVDWGEYVSFFNYLCVATNTCPRHQKLVASGFKHMVDSLHTSGKFRPFVAMMLMAWVSTEGQVNFEWQVDLHLRWLADSSRLEQGRGRARRHSCAPTIQETVFGTLHRHCQQNA